MRAIDGELLEFEISNIAKKLAKSDAQKALMGRVMYVIEHTPTLPQPSNEPLTLEQLREMDGEPVWVECLKPDKYVDPPKKWRILEKSITGDFGVWNGENALIERVYGADWLAYRRPPEGEEET